MCVAAIAWDAHPRWRLVAVGNRDEYHDRPSAPLARWQDDSGVIAGRDLRGGGTWMGVTGAGRFVLVTNFRVPGYPLPDRPSRGGLVTELLGGGDPLAVPVAAYNPFSLLCAAPDAAHFIGNHPAEARLPLSPGIHGLSNGAFERPWPKTRQLNAALASWLGADGGDFAPLFAALRAETPTPPDSLMPDTPEPRFAPVFIRDPVYGTRCSTVLAIGRDGQGLVTERSFAPDGTATGDVTLPFRWPAG